MTFFIFLNVTMASIWDLVRAPPDDFLPQTLTNFEYAAAIVEPWRRFVQLKRCAMRKSGEDPLSRMPIDMPVSFDIAEMAS